jgi:hypothetical protein
MRAFVVLLLVTFTVDASAQTIAEIARRERARQKQDGRKSTGTFTNAGAAGTPAATPQPPASTSAPSAPGTTADKNAQSAPKPTGPLDNKGRDEKYWRDAFRKAREAVRQADQKVQYQEARVQDLNTQFLRQNDIYNKENILGAQINAAQKDLDAAKAEAEQARNNVSKLEDELRASNGLPGWAR